MNKKKCPFFKRLSLVFPILANTDLYIGDMSSIGYDYLIFDKPLFFLNKQNFDVEQDRRAYLFRCGVDIKPNDFPNLYPIIEKSLPNDLERFSEIRKQTWDYTFGPQRPFADIKADIIEACK